MKLATYGDTFLEKTHDILIVTIRVDEKKK